LARVIGILSNNVSCSLTTHRMWVSVDRDITGETRNYDLSKDCSTSPKFLEYHWEMSHDESNDWLSRVRHAHTSGSHGSPFAMALDEIRAGRKTSHWVWYVFPQIEGLGTSPMNQLFAVSTVEDARQFLADDIVGTNFEIILEAAVNHLESGSSLAGLMNGDEQKFVSSLTLMRNMADKPEQIDLTRRAILLVGAQGFSPCRTTLRWLDERGISQPAD